MKKRNLILHIGDPKTGSSSIQRALQLGLVQGQDANVSVFTTNIHSANAINVARGFFNPHSRKMRASMREITSWLRHTDADYPIISSEFFSSADPALLHDAFSKVQTSVRKPGLIAQILSRLFPQNPRYLAQDVKVIAYVRPHPGRALSAFSERVRFGYTLHDFSDWLPAALKTDLLIYSPRFQAWRDSFGDQFTLRPFLREELAGGDVVVDFFKNVFGKRKFAIAESVNTNESLGLKSLAGLLACNREMVRLGMPLKTRIPLARVISGQLSQSGDKPQLDRRSVAQIDHACRDDAKALDREFFGRPLFQNALDQAARKATDDPVDLTFGKYFTPAQQAQLRQQAKALQQLVGADHDDWHRHYQENRMRHNLGHQMDTEGGGDIQKRLHDLALLLR